MQCATETNIKNKTIAILINKLCTLVVRASLFNDVYHTHSEMQEHRFSFIEAPNSVVWGKRLGGWGNQEISVESHVNVFNETIFNVLSFHCSQFDTQEAYASLSERFFLLPPSLCFHCVWVSFLKWNIEILHRLLNWNNEVSNKVSFLWLLVLLLGSDFLKKKHKFELKIQIHMQMHLSILHVYVYVCESVHNFFFITRNIRGNVYVLLSHGYTSTLDAPISLAEWIHKMSMLICMQWK